MKRTLFGAILLITLFGSFCGKKVDRHGIDLQIQLTPATITDSLYLKMDYEFKTEKDFKKLDGDYSVFVHFWRTNSKEMLLQDDHFAFEKNQ